MTSSAIDKMFEIFGPIFEHNITINFEPIFEQNANFGPIFKKSVNFEYFVKGRWMQCWSKFSCRKSQASIYMVVIGQTYHVKEHKQMWQKKVSEVVYISV